MRKQRQRKKKRFGSYYHEGGLRRWLKTQRALRRP